MKELDLYALWCEKATDPEIAAELKEIEGDSEAIEDRFYADLEFGTAGLRGVLGAGTIRMNVYTVGRATQGLADYLNGQFSNPSVVIAYDSRIKSDIFSKQAATVLAANNIKVYIFPELMPTPVLSFAVRHLKTSSGIVVTASHNPAKYNGYKAYGPDGCQMTSEAANAVLARASAVDIFSGVKNLDFEAGVQSDMITVLGDDVLNAYLTKVREQAVHEGVAAEAGLKVVYTPLNGTGNKPVRKILAMTGVNNVYVVPEQEMPDGNFPTAPFPNPEIRQSFECALKLAKQVQPDLLLATDPDADRVGIAVLKDGDYVLMSGNEVGAMLLDYLCAQRILKGTYPERPVVVKTIVTSAICGAIAQKYNAQLVEVLTGFKFIGEQIGLLEAKGEENRYVFGFEESYGYLAGSYVRDKDAVVASMLICEMAAFYKKQGKSLYDVMQDLYAEFGFYLNSVSDISREGASGMQELANIMIQLRANCPNSLGGLRVTGVADYDQSVNTDIVSGTTDPITLPKSNVLSYRLENGAMVIVRPSGTEPKIKIYITAKADTRESAAEMTEQIRTDVSLLLGVK